MSLFVQYCLTQERKYGERFVAPQGAAFIDAYNKGSDYRIKVRTVYGEKEVHERWGYVGLTTGWVPCFILMRNIRQRGSSDVLNPEKDKVVACKWLKRKYT